MSMTRLRFLSILSSGFAFAAAGVGRMLASPDRETVVLSSASFHQLKNTTFSVSGPRGVVRLVLEDVKAGPQDRRTNQFTLIFAGADSAKLPEGTYPVAHPRLDAFAIYVVPAGTSGDGKTRYRADFNLLRN